MLETVREFVAERMAAQPDAAEVGRRHAGFYRALAEQADRPLRGGPSVWLERVDAEAGNLAAAVRWYLDHDPGPLPHLFRVLWLFWLQRDLEGQARSWVEHFRDAAGPLDLQARAELSLVEAVIAVHTGDDAAALAARQRLAPLLARIRDPFLHAACQLARPTVPPLLVTSGARLPAGRRSSSAAPSALAAKPTAIPCNARAANSAPPRAPARTGCTPPCPRHER